MAWNLVMSIKGKEELASINLIRQGYHVYYPVIRVDKRTAKGSELDYQPMFAGYIFVELTPGKDDFSPIRSTKGVIRLVQFGPYPAIVPQIIVDSLRASEDNNGIHQICKFDYDRGDKIRVVSGPFEGFEAIFKHRDSVARATILLNGIQKLQLSYRDIEPAA